MSPPRRIFRSVSFSVAGTIASLGVVSRLAGMGVPIFYWVFAVLCSGALSTIVSARLVFQSERMKHLYEDLRHAHAQLKVSADTDPLTGLLNRGAFFREVALLRSQDEAGWLVVLDVDHFKSVNDRFGHDVGDRALERVGETIRRAVRRGDLVGRLGGEEFAIYLPHADQEEAMVIAERVRSLIAESPAFEWGGQSHHVTVSLGLAQDGEEPLRDNLRRADIAMYRAKDSGRNQVALAA